MSTLAYVLHEACILVGAWTISSWITNRIVMILEKRKSAKVNRSRES